MKGDFDKYGIPEYETRGMEVNNISYREYVETNPIHPWYLQLKPTESGLYETHFPSMPLVKPFGFQLSGQVFGLEQFELKSNVPGTGSSLQVYQRVSNDT